MRLMLFRQGKKESKVLQGRRQRRSHDIFQGQSTIVKREVKRLSGRKKRGLPRLQSWKGGQRSRGEILLIRKEEKERGSWSLEFISVRMKMRSAPESQAWKREKPPKTPSPFEPPPEYSKEK